MMKAHALGAPRARSRLLEQFSAAGVAAERVLLLGPEDSAAGHLGRYREVDIALDTYPYNGTTTTCEALWMGVPVVTLSGPTHVSRVGASLLKRLALETGCRTARVPRARWRSPPTRAPGCCAMECARACSFAAAGRCGLARPWKRRTRPPAAWLAATAGGQGR
jgi:hypothetical protein